MFNTGITTSTPGPPSAHYSSAPGRGALEAHARSGFTNQREDLVQLVHRDGTSGPLFQQLPWHQAELAPGQGGPLQRPGTSCSFCTAGGWLSTTASPVGSRQPPGFISCRRSSDTFAPEHWKGLESCRTGLFLHQDPIHPQDSQLLTAPGLSLTSSSRRTATAQFKAFD